MQIIGTYDEYLPGFTNDLRDVHVNLITKWLRLPKAYTRFTISQNVCEKPLFTFRFMLNTWMQNE